MYSLGHKKTGCGGPYSCSLEHARAASKATKRANKYVETVGEPKYSTLSLVGL